MDLSAQFLIAAAAISVEATAAFVFGLTSAEIIFSNINWLAVTIKAVTLLKAQNSRKAVFRAVIIRDKLSAGGGVLQHIIIENIAIIIHPGGEGDLIRPQSQPVRLI